MRKTYNNHTACAPFESTSMKQTIKRGMATIEQKTNLAKTITVFASEKFPAPGVAVYLRGESIAHEWAKQVYDLGDGVKFILVPDSFILMSEDLTSKDALKELTELSQELGLYEQKK